MLLATLRAGVVLLLVCIFLGPALVYLQHRTIQPSMVVLRDASQSMNTADATTDDAAAKIVAAALHRRPSEIRPGPPDAGGRSSTRSGDGNAQAACRSGQAGQAAGPRLRRPGDEGRDLRDAKKVILPAAAQPKTPGSRSQCRGTSSPACRRSWPRGAAPTCGRPIRQSLASRSARGGRAVHRRPAHRQGRRPRRPPAKPRQRGVPLLDRRRRRSEPAAEPEGRQRLRPAASLAGGAVRDRRVRSRPRGSMPARSASS